MSDNHREVLQIVLEAGSKAEASALRSNALLAEVRRLQAEAPIQSAIAVEIFSALTVADPQKAGKLLDSLLTQFFQTAHHNGFLNVSELLEQISSRLGEGPKERGKLVR